MKEGLPDWRGWYRHRAAAGFCDMSRSIETTGCAVCRDLNYSADERCANCGRRLHLASPVVTLRAQRLLSASPTQRADRQLAVSLAKTSIAREGKRLRSAAQKFGLPTDSARERIITCDRVPASYRSRAVAVAVDAGIVGVSMGLFVAVFVMLGGDLILTPATATVWVVLTTLVGQMYQLFWCLAGGDTPGLKLAGLRLIDCDGRRPDWRRRCIRQISRLASLLVVGLGVVWALFDSEKLTWHDRSTRTFVTTQ